MSFLFKIRNYNRLVRLCEDCLDFYNHADFSNGVEANGVDEGRINAGRYIQHLQKRLEKLYTPERKLRDAITRKLEGR